MKLPITDKFLWELFRLSQRIEDLFNFLGFYSWKEVFVPPGFSAQRIYEKRKAKQKFSHFLCHLIKQGYIRVKTPEPNQGFFITQKGIEKFFKAALFYLTPEVQ